MRPTTEVLRIGVKKALLERVALAVLKVGVLLEQVARALPVVVVHRGSRCRGRNRDDEGDDESDCLQTCHPCYLCSLSFGSFLVLG